MVGQRVSHANNKTKRRFNPNLHVKRFWLKDENRYVKLRVSAKAMRIIDRVGLEKVLQNMGMLKAKKEKPKEKPVSE